MILSPITFESIAVKFFTTEMSLLNAIVAIPSLLIEKREALSSKGLLFKFLLIFFLKMAFPKREEKAGSPP